MRNELKAVLRRLYEIELLVTEYIGGANISGREERLEDLEAELEAIQAAIEALLEID